MRLLGKMDQAQGVGDKAAGDTGPGSRFIQCDQIVIFSFIKRSTRQAPPRFPGADNDGGTEVAKLKQQPQQANITKIRT